MYGGNGTDNEFMKEVIREAKLHPGVTIYFQSPVPTDIRGTPEDFIGSGVYTPDTGFLQNPQPEGPGMIGLIDPEAFTSKRS